ncbi:calcium-binding protein [Plectonema cf. radiosum LEGE 06105]|uniref:Calcium-binding protein n=1 Tax=Plectonema cf. radiosum LEGE 06105 TaxID=945769 RepID=A0A8J7K0Q1_9CYAN|nr:calcium-binding protein [Plectonema radiosum]MBE9213931.1 calcium-binding protein [Plectonema cf. radiosum LEGE 06105]
MTENLTLEQELQLEAVAEAEGEQPSATQEAIFESTQPVGIQLTPEQQTRLEILQQQESEALQPPPSQTPGFEPDLQVPTTDSTISGLNRIIGTPNGETIIGTDINDNIIALGGDDEIFGQAGDDIISGGGENDVIEGNAGVDLIFGDYSASENSSLIGSGNDTIYGNEGDDILYGQDREDTIYGGDGNDYAEGGDGNDLVYGNQGEDTLYGDSFEGEPFSTVGGDDTVIGGGGNDKVYGGKGNDILEGNQGSDELTGGQGNDELKGGRGKDKLIGTDTDFFGRSELGFGFGERDTLTGGRDNDTFVLGLAEANGRDENGNDVVIQDVVLYNNSNIDSNGIGDYALITDFGFVGDGVIRGADKIQLAGSESMYSLGTSPIDNISGTAIFLNEGQNTSELIALVQEISVETLSLNDTTQFVFV